MNTYTVFAVFEDDPTARYTENVEATSPAAAEQEAIDHAPSPIIVASVVEGKVVPVDRVSDHRVSPLKGTGYKTNVTKVLLRDVPLKLPPKCPGCGADLKKANSISQMDLLAQTCLGHVPRGAHNHTNHRTGVTLNRETSDVLHVVENGGAVKLTCEVCDHVLWDGWS